MSRIVLGIIAALLIVMGVVGLIGHSAGWSSFAQPVWLSWGEVLVGIISFVIAASDTKG